MPKKQAITRRENLSQLYLEAGRTKDSVVDREFRNRILFLLFVDNKDQKLLERIDLWACQKMSKIDMRQGDPNFRRLESDQDRSPVPQSRTKRVNGALMEGQLY